MRVLNSRLWLVLIILVILSPLTLVPPVSAQSESRSTWSRTFGQILGPDSIEVTSDGGFVVLVHENFGFGGRVMKANLAGDIEWDRYYIPPGYGDAHAYSIRQTKDRGFIVAGTALRPQGSFQTHAWLLKLDNDGGVQWSRIYRSGGFLWVEQTRDGGYIVAGMANGPDPSDGWVLKLDPEGNIVWQEMFRDQDISSVDQADDGGFVVAGTVGVNSRADAWVFKLDAEGRMVWQRAFDAGLRTDAYSVQHTIDGGYIVTGEIAGVNTHGEGFSKALILKLDAKGDMIWQRVYGGLNDFLFDIQGTTDGATLVAGYLFETGSAWVLKLDDKGIIRGCPLGVPSNATLTDSAVLVADTTVTGISTSGTVNQTTVTITPTKGDLRTLCFSPSKARDESVKEKRTQKGTKRIET